MCDTPGFQIKSFHGGGKECTLLCLHDKIIIPHSLQTHVVEWYHNQLCHPGESRTELTIKQHVKWKNLHKDVQDTCRKCYTCQLTKRTKKKYGKLPEKQAEAEPWDKLCVDLIGPYKFPRKQKSTLTLWCVMMIDPATGWFEIKQIPMKRADVVANIVEQTWM